MPTGTTTVGAVAARVFESFPREWAEPWDNVGLVVGDTSEHVRGVLVTLDPTRQAVERLAEDGGNLLVTHHPPFFEAPAPVARSGAAGIAALALSLGVSIVSAHTNLDRAPDGGDALCAALGLDPISPLERGVQPMSLVRTYVPATHVEAVIDAMSLAGAGRVGLYEGAAFQVEGEGRFTPLPGSEPMVGSVDEPARAREMRVEMVCAPTATPDVVLACLGAHPYDEPLVIASEVTIARGAARLGRVSELPVAATLADLVTQVSERLHVTPRVWGRPERPVRLVATATGSGRSLIGDALAGGIDVLVTGEVRYHDATDALESGLAIVEAGHDATEWPLVPVLADAVRATPGLAPDAVAVDSPSVRWWTPRSS